MSIHTIAYIINHISTQFMIVYSLSMHPEGSQNLLGVFKWIMLCVSHKGPITPEMLLWKHNNSPFFFESIAAWLWNSLQQGGSSVDYQRDRLIKNRKWQKQQDIFFKWFGACIVKVISVHLQRLRVLTMTRGLVRTLINNVITLPESNSKSTWKWMGGSWNSSFLLGWPISRANSKFQRMLFIGVSLDHLKDLYWDLIKSFPTKKKKQINTITQSQNTNRVDNITTCKLSFFWVLYSFNCTRHLKVTLTSINPRLIKGVTGLRVGCFLHNPNETLLLFSVSWWKVTKYET